MIHSFVGVDRAVLDYLIVAVEAEKLLDYHMTVLDEAAMPVEPVRVIWLEGVLRNLA